MEDNKTKILREFEELKGQTVLFIHGGLERLVAVGQDEWDYYWVSYDGRKLRWHTCLERIVPLKGFIRDKDYNEIIRLSKLNHWDQIGLDGQKDEEKIKEALKFHEEHKREVVVLGEKDELMTSICWDLN